jgi:excisionase family DNA binding protein
MIGARNTAVGSSEVGVDEAVESDILTVPEAADWLRVGKNALYDAIGRGEIPHRRIGKHIRLSRAALIQWLAWSERRAEE